MRGGGVAVTTLMAASALIQDPLDLAPRLGLALEKPKQPIWAASDTACLRDTWAWHWFQNHLQCKNKRGGGRERWQEWQAGKKSRSQNNIPLHSTQKASAFGAMTGTTAAMAPATTLPDMLVELSNSKVPSNQLLAFLELELDDTELTKRLHIFTLESLRVLTISSDWGDDTPPWWCFWFWKQSPLMEGQQWDTVMHSSDHPPTSSSTMGPQPLALCKWLPNASINSVVEPIKSDWPREPHQSKYDLPPPTRCLVLMATISKSSRPQGHTTSTQHLHHLENQTWLWLWTCPDSPHCISKKKWILNLNQAQMETGKAQITLPWIWASCQSFWQKTWSLTGIWVRGRWRHYTPLSHNLLLLCQTMSMT